MTVTEAGLFFTLAGILAYRSLDYFAMCLKLKQAVIRASITMPQNEARKFLALRQMVGRTKSAAKVRKVICHFNIARELDSSAPFIFMGLMIAILFALGSMQAISLSIATIIASTTISAFGLFVEAFRLQIERI